MYLEALKKYKVTFTAIVFVVLLNSCKATTSEPIEDNTPGSREYTWTVDTLITPDTYLLRFWGTSPTNLWATGIGVWSEYNLWHYDGSKWTKGNLKEFGHISPNSIIGFSDNNIWLAGEQGKIWNGDGKIWTESFKYNSGENRPVVFSGIWGDSPDNIYAVGAYNSLINNKDYNKGLILHYNGSKWQRVQLEENRYQFFHIYRENKVNSNYYLMGTATDYSDWSDTLKFFEFDGNRVREIYSQFYTSNTMLGMILMQGKIYFFINSDMCRYINGRFEVIKTIPGTNKGYVLGGRNENDLFFAMPEGIAHFNGTDLQIIYKKPEFTYIYHLAVFEKEVFIMADVIQEKSYIIKGKLK